MNARFKEGMLKPSWVLTGALLLLTACATSDMRSPLANSMGSYQAPTYCEGDVWVYAYGENRTRMIHGVSRIKDGLVEMDSNTIDYCRGCRFIFDQNLALQQMLRADGTSIARASDRKWWEFPLEVGKTWRFTIPADMDGTGATRNGTSDWMEVTLLVEALEDVTVLAGTFRAFRVRRDFYAYPPGSRASGTRWSQRFWFAPEAKWAVKYTSTRPGEQEWELSSYYLECRP